MLDKSVIENLKRIDPDRYRAAMLAPKVDREALFVLYGFHAELAKVPEMVSETMIGNIRYQWWRDAIDEIFTEKPVRKHEITLPLDQVIAAKNLPRYSFDRLIDGRERDLDPSPFANIEDARAYCKDTSGQLMQLAGNLVSGTNQEADLSLLGQSWGLTGLARSWKYYHNGMLSELKFSELLEAAKIDYSKAVSGLQKINPELFPVIAYGSLIPKFIDKMQRPNYNPETMTPNYSPLSKKLSLMGTVLRGKI